MRSLVDAEDDSRESRTLDNNERSGHYSVFITGMSVVGSVIFVNENENENDEKNEKIMNSLTKTKTKTKKL